jgi:predicted membrane chloride channel (bestrophin family)
MTGWRQRYPEAAEAWGHMVLSSPDVVRKMRMTDPDWEPPR